MNPLVTLLLVTYNQESFIQDAVNSLLSQDYSPLEIVLSDDCSVDGTYDRLVSLARDYHGIHIVKCRRNGSNQGLMGHIEAAVQECNGKLIVIAAGDDVSLPNRVSVMAKEWIRCGAKSGSFFAGTYEVDAKLNRICEQAPPAFEFNAESLLNYRSVVGASHAFTRDMFELFPKSKGRILNEDSVIFFRSALLGTINTLSVPLVKHRSHSMNMHRGMRGFVRGPEDLRRYWLSTLRNRIAVIECHLTDIDSVKVEQHTKIWSRVRSRLLTELNCSQLLLSDSRTRRLWGGIRMLTVRKRALRFLFEFFFPRSYLWMYRKFRASDGPR